MKTVTFFLFISTFFSNLLYAQEEVSTTPLTSTLTLNFVPIGAGLVSEIPIGKKSTIRLEAGSVFGVNPQVNNYKDIEVGIGFTPYGNIGYRYFYDFKEDTEDRKFFYNSGNFIFAQVNGYTPPIFATDNFSFKGRVSAGLGWGIQRVFANNFVFSIGGGFGYYWPQKNISVIGDLTMGILLKPKK